jgi:hypothetical protein
MDRRMAITHCHHALVPQFSGGTPGQKPRFFKKAGFFWHAKRVPQMRTDDLLGDRDQVLTCSFSVYVASCGVKLQVKA